jgi:hypothetical protein
VGSVKADTAIPATLVNLPVLPKPSCDFFEGPSTQFLLPGVRECLFPRFHTSRRSPSKRPGKRANGLCETRWLQCVSVGYDTARIGDYVKTVPQAMPKRRSKFSRNRVIARRQPDDDEIDIIQTGTAGRLGKRGPKMNSYINLIFDAEGAKERLQRLFQTAPEQSAADFFDSRLRSGANRANKHSAFAQADSLPCSQVGPLVSAEIGFSVWLGSPSFPFLLFFASRERHA